MSDETGKQDVAPVGAMKLATRQIIGRLQDGQSGDRVTYEELTELTRCTFGVVMKMDASGQSFGVPGTGNSYLASAMKHCVNNHSLVWKIDRGTDSIVCLDATAVNVDCRAGLRKAHRGVKRTVKRGGTVDLNELPTDTARTSHVSLMSMLGAAVLFTSTNAVKKAETRQITGVVDSSRMLELFKT